MGVVFSFLWGGRCEVEGAGGGGCAVEVLAAGVAWRKGGGVSVGSGGWMGEGGG